MGNKLGWIGSIIAVIVVAGVRILAREGGEYVGKEVVESATPVDLKSDFIKGCLTDFENPQVKEMFTYAQVQNACDRLWGACGTVRPLTAMRDCVQGKAPYVGCMIVSNENHEHCSKL